MANTTRTTTKSEKFHHIFSRIKLFLIGYDNDNNNKILQITKYQHEPTGLKEGGGGMKKNYISPIV